MEGVSSIRLHASKDYVSDKSNHFIRWTEVFLLTPEAASDDRHSFDFGPQDPMVAATAIGKSVCAAMSTNLRMIIDNNLTPFAVRVNLDPEQVWKES